MIEPKLTIALPNKGRLSDGTVDFLDKCALTVNRHNKRQYQCKMSGISEGVEVVFQRARDIPKVVKEGRVDLGITGYDIFCENGGETNKCYSIFPDSKNIEDRKIQGLPYGECSLVIAVPEHWVDIDSVYDLAELSIKRKKDNKIIRVATEFPNMTQNFLYQVGISYFEITEVFGATESAPKMGSADFITDIKSSGVTLSENKLKEVSGGEILKSSACLIASESIKKEHINSDKHKLTKQIIDRIEAHLNSKKYWLITGNVSIKGSKESELKDELCRGLNDSERHLLGQEGPTIAKVLNIKDSQSTAEKNFYSVSIQVESENLEEAISILRGKTGRNILVSPISFVYDNEPSSYNRLLEKFNKKEQ